MRDLDDIITVNRARTLGPWHTEVDAILYDMQLRHDKEQSDAAYELRQAEKGPNWQDKCAEELAQNERVANEPWGPYSVYPRNQAVEVTVQDTCFLNEWDTPTRFPLPPEEDKTG